MLLGTEIEFYFNGQTENYSKSSSFPKHICLYNLNKIDQVITNFVNTVHIFSVFKCGTSKSPLTRMVRFYMQSKTKALVSSIFVVIYSYPPVIELPVRLQKWAIFPSKFNILHPQAHLNTWIKNIWNYHCFWLFGDRHLLMHFYRLTTLY